MWRSCTVPLVPRLYGAPPAGEAAAGPRPDLRGHRLAVEALLLRPHDELLARRLHGLVGGFVAGLLVGLGVLAVGVPAVPAVLVAAATNYVASLVLPRLLLSPADRRLHDVAVRVVESAARSWRRAYGSAPMFRSEEQSLLWMAAQPTTTSQPDALEIECSVLLSLGRYADARERAERIPDDTPWWRFTRTLALSAIDHESGGRGDLADARAAAEAVHGERRGDAVAALGLEEAARAMIRGDDWAPPIERAAAAIRQPLVDALLVTLSRARMMLPWLLVSEVALGAVLFVAAGWLGS